jgi:DNA polymerase-1
MTKKFALIDGKSVFYRGYYAMPNLTTKDGVPTGGVYGFASLALELLKKIEPDYVAVAWDKPKTNIRRRLAIYDKYKANRHPAPPDFYAQIPLLNELLDAFGWPLYEMDDYEADDLMGTLSRQANEQKINTIMISSDLDMLQLIDHDTELYALKKGLANLEKFDVAAFEKKYGLRVDQFLDLKSLKGDASDNIPGVPGIGEKSAITLLQEFGSLDEIYVHLDDIKPVWRAKLVAGRDSAYMSKELGKIWCDAPLELDLTAVDVKKFDRAKLLEVLKKFEFSSLIRRLPEFITKNDAPDSHENLAFDFNEPVDTPGIFFTLPNGKIVVNDGKTLAENILSSSSNPQVSSLDLFRGSNADSRDKHENDSRSGENDKEIVLPEIEFDTRIAGFLLGRVEKVGNLEQLKTVYEEQKIRLAQIPNLEKVARELDFPMQNLLAKIEARGVRVDVEILKKISANLGEKIAQLEHEIWNIAGHEFNVSSAPQLSDVLYKELKLPTAGIKKSVRGYYSTGKKELDKLRGKHEIIDKITQVREVLKLKNTYTDALPELVAADGKLHTDFRQDVTATGRLSSSNPNLQNIPTRTELGQEIRHAFVASPGKILVSADYSQFELRLAAALAHDTNLIEDFQDDSVDIHTKTAAEAYGVPFDDVTPDMRRHAKVINFGVLYGMSPHGLSAATDMSFSAAKDFIERYFRVRQPISDFLGKTLEQAKTKGYVETLFGRRRPTPDVNSPNFMVREAAKRAAANMPIQGTEADLMKMAMLKIEDELSEIAPQILQIHDSIIVECAPENVEKVSAKMREIMENIYPEIGVRLKVDVKSGETWGDL